jgi:L-ribulose-5-phosphate 3-epimerase
MFFGYNTNGFAHHRLDDAIAILADLGYGGVALTVDYHALDPRSPEAHRAAERVRGLLEKLGLRCVVETGARFLLDPRRKHQPTLLSPSRAERETRCGYLRECIKLAAHLGADALSFWSGTPVDAAPDDILWQRLTDGCGNLIAEAADLGVPLAFEPEPGMFIDTMERFESLMTRLEPAVASPHPEDERKTRGVFGLTLDIGHLHCMGETPIADQIHRWRDVLWNVHIEDMRRGVHDHLMFGEGEIDFAPVLAALKKIDYAGGAYVELSRHSHDAVRVAERSLTYLKSINLATPLSPGTPGERGRG